jgi:predicted unusual protein kinase regulating ubiquinone biosynthesis (AarF/ABC1/UbiB family)
MIRLIRALWVFGIILTSYLVQLGLGRVFGGAWVERRWPALHARNARRMYRGFVRLRGVYVKLGQVLSVMGTFLPKAYVDELEGLQDEVPPRPYREIARAVRRALGRTPAEAFARFATTPLAAASLGQVHEATTHEGERVAVKVLYPNVETILRIDLRVLGWVLKVYRRFVPVRQIERVHEQLRDLLERETDLVNEARCIERMTRNFADDPDVLLPAVYPALSSRAVLTMGFMDGVKIGRPGEIEKLGLDPVAVATKLIQISYKQLFLDRFFHADPHPGNFFVQRGAAGQVRIVILDLGSASDLPVPLADGMLDVLTGVIRRDDALVLRGVETMGFVAADGDRALLEQVTRTYFTRLLNLDLTQLQRLGPEVGKQLDPGLQRDELRRLMASVEYPLGWLYVERTLVILFGLSLKLAPRLNTLEVGFPYVMKFLAEGKRPTGAA